MIYLDEAKYKDAHKHSSKHRAEVLASTSAACFYCGRSFPPSSIEEWVDDNETALCPHCGIDSVIGDASGVHLGESFLYLMNEYWFRRYEGEVLEQAHERKWRHRTLLESGTLCACFHCVCHFDTSDIKEWVRPWEGGGMALCPYCGIDSVIAATAPFSLLLGFLRGMSNYWFQRDPHKSRSKPSI